MSNTRRKPDWQTGFTLLETMMAIVILTIGLLALAGLLTKVSSSTSESGYMSQASLLASEKLEDLSHLASTDPSITVPTGNTAGDLATNTSQVVAGQTVAYWDEVRLSSGNGGVSETIQGTDAGGNTVFTTVVHNPDGTVKTNTAAADPGASPDTVTFELRWVIEKDQPITGVRRVTVLVSLKSQAPGPPVKFQTSMVRP